MIRREVVSLYHCHLCGEAGSHGDVDQCLTALRQALAALTVPRRPRPAPRPTSRLWIKRIAVGRFEWPTWWAPTGLVRTLGRYETELDARAYIGRARADGLDTRHWVIFQVGRWPKRRHPDTAAIHSCLYSG